MKNNDNTIILNNICFQDLVLKKKKKTNKQGVV